MHNNFIDEKCPVCGETFAPDSDIVVCPECGAPHHRECFHTAGHCAYEQQHAEGFEWKGEKQKMQEHFLNMEEQRIQNEQNAAAEGNAPNTDEEYDDDTELMEAATLEEFKEAMERRITRQIRDFKTDEGVTGEEMIQYVGKNVPYYIPVFTDMLKNKKVMRLNCAAFFFSPFHCFYRRMNLFGTIITLLMTLIFELRSMLTTVLFGSAQMTAEQANIIVMASGIVFCAVLFFVLLFFNYFYLRTAIKRIKQIKAECPSSREELMFRLHVEGRPSLFNAVVYPMCIFFIVSIAFRMLNIWMGL
ncbi:MAG: hypothetical protein J1E39_08065 [Eubacterium sp.]|nr:hypothetical protein [Eubacterium sp.]